MPRYPDDRRPSGDPRYSNGPRPPKDGMYADDRRYAEPPRYAEGGQSTYDEPYPDQDGYPDDPHYSDAYGYEESAGYPKAQRGGPAPRQEVYRDRPRPAANRQPHPPPEVGRPERTGRATRDGHVEVRGDGEGYDRGEADARGVRGTSNARPVRGMPGESGIRGIRGIPDAHSVRGEPERVPRQQQVPRTSPARQRPRDAEERYADDPDNGAYDDERPPRVRPSRRESQAVPRPAGQVRERAASGDRQTAQPPAPGSAPRRGDGGAVRPSARAPRREYQESYQEGRYQEGRYQQGEYQQEAYREDRRDARYRSGGTLPHHGGRDGYEDGFDAYQGGDAEAYPPQEREMWTEYGSGGDVVRPIVRTQSAGRGTGNLTARSNRQHSDYGEDDRARPARSRAQTGQAGAQAADGAQERGAARRNRRGEQQLPPAVEAVRDRWDVILVVLVASIIMILPFARTALVGAAMGSDQLGRAQAEKAERILADNGWAFIGAPMHSAVNLASADADDQRRLKTEKILQFSEDLGVPQEQALAAKSDLAYEITTTAQGGKKFRAHLLFDGAKNVGGYMELTGGMLLSLRDHAMRLPDGLTPSALRPEEIERVVLYGPEKTANMPHGECMMSIGEKASLEMVRGYLKKARLAGSTSPIGDSARLQATYRGGGVVEMLVTKVGEEQIVVQVPSIGACYTQVDFNLFRLLQGAKGWSDAQTRLEVARENLRVIAPDWTLLDSGYSMAPVTLRGTTEVAALRGLSSAGGIIADLHAGEEYILLRWPLQEAPRDELTRKMHACFLFSKERLVGGYLEAPWIDEAKSLEIPARVPLNDRRWM